MKRKTLIIFSILFIILNLVFAGKIYAANICTVGFSVTNSTPQREEEVAVTVSVKNITEAIASVGFTVQYDSEIFDTPVVETLNGWTQQVAGTTYALIAPANEGTTRAEDIYKLKFKVKSDAAIGETKIGFTNLQVAKDDGSVVNIEGVENNITIKEKQQEQSQDEQNQDEQNQDEQNQDDQNQDEQSQDEQKNDENNTEKSKNQTTDTSSNKDTSNQNIKTINSKEDNTKASNTLPKTGKTQLLITGIIVLALVAGVSYKVYRKYKGI